MAELFAGQADAEYKESCIQSHLVYRLTGARDDKDGQTAARYDDLETCMAALAARVGVGWFVIDREARLDFYRVAHRPEGVRAEEWNSCLESSSGGWVDDSSARYGSSDACIADVLTSVKRLLDTGNEEEQTFKTRDHPITPRDIPHDDDEASALEGVTIKVDVHGEVPRALARIQVWPPMDSATHPLKVALARLEGRVPFSHAGKAYVIAVSEIAQGPDNVINKVSLLITDQGGNPVSYLSFAPAL